MKVRCFLIGLGLLTAFAASGQAPQKKPLPPLRSPQTTSPSNRHSTPNSSSSQSTSEALANSIANSVGEGMRAFGDAAARGTTIDIEGYPNLSFMGGISRYTGEFLKLKWNIGGMGGFNISGAIGKDWIWNLPNKDKLAWNFALGLYFAFESYNLPAQDAITIDLAFGETPCVQNYGLMIDFEYEHWFGDSPFGFFISGGIGIGDTKDRDGKFIWDVAGGFAIKIWEN